MARRPIISIPRTAQIYQEMLWARRELYKDHQFFVMTEAWEKICEENDDWQIRAYHSDPSVPVKHKAGVVFFNGRMTLTTDQRLLDDAEKGCRISNFILAHELGHVALGHHATGAVVKNFQLFDGPTGLSNLPPTVEELEANYAAAFFQCGAALSDLRWGVLDLARRAASDVTYVKHARSAVLLPGFQVALDKLSTPNPRVVL
ncbi:ImmA/IrrE family metallo-endopeptidase [Roseicyclus marinus]|uniref:ImmA/IrrE family metallo-endopeptidase n=1 Tax=Roseicyclus marinus TaxID=2161673 RepID=UPI0024105438|nr:hypothetical protein [Roseicyclus marinus]MDG3040161.1 hypothetical protein [Roseicyclus marinus]